MMLRTLKIATLNVRRSAITKIAAVHEAATDIDILALQEADINAPSLAGFVEQWQKLGYYVNYGPPSPDAVRRVVLLSKLACRPITLHLNADADRWCLSLFELVTPTGYFKFLDSVYGHSGQVATARHFATECMLHIRTLGLP